MKDCEKNREPATRDQDHRSGNGICNFAAGIILCVMIAAAGLFCAGCRTGAREVVARPARHSIRSDQLLILSDFKLPRDHPLVVELISLRKQISQTLDLPIQQQEVVVYIFSSE